MSFSDIDLLSVNSIRTLSIDAVQKANSGHPGMPLGAAPMAYVLFQRHLKFNPKNPNWFDRDRFVLSAGHGSMLVYSLLHLYGYDVTMDDVKNFRQWKSKTPGHPEYFLTPGVEATTGPLGQGTANVVGMAIAERKLADLLKGSALVDHYTYAIVSDGDLMEGISAEAASLAGHLQLGKLICLYDSNDISLDGPTSMTFSTEDVAQRYESYGWQVLYVQNGDTDLDAIDVAIQEAKTDTLRPSLIVVKTTIGFGSPNKAGKSSSHGSPLGPDEVAATKAKLGWKSNESFFVPQEVYDHCALAAKRGQQEETTWNKILSVTETKNPQIFKTFKNCVDQKFSDDTYSSLPVYSVGEDMASREAGGKILNAIANKVPFFFGGDADLSCSTNTAIKDGGSFNGQTGAGRNIHYGVREHAMGAIANGIAYHGGLRSYTATFFCFFDYMKPALRLSALNHLPVTYVYTHDSIGLGEDGPTHQPVEHLMALRAIPNTITLRPCDANETREAWWFAMNRKDGPTALVFSRQKLKTLDRSKMGSEKGLARGAYILSAVDGAEMAIVATGSEVGLALEVQESLKAKGVMANVISMPSIELFMKQDSAYQESVLPRAMTKRVSIEAGVTFGWKEIVGTDGLCIGVDQFGTSAPAPKIYEEYGLTNPKITERILKWLAV